MKEQEYRGYWWPEGDPENQVPGILSFYPGKYPELNLFSNFYPPNQGRNYEIIDLDLDQIHGITEDAERVTLFQAQRQSISYKQKGEISMRPATWTGDLIIVGESFVHNNPALDKVTVQYYGQNEWGRWSDISWDRDMSNPPRWSTGDSLELRYELPPSLSHYIDGTEIRFSTTFSQNIENYNSGTITIEHEFKIIPKRTRVPIQEYLEHIRKLRQFVTFGLGERTVSKNISGQIDGQEVDILKPVGSVPSDISVHPKRMLFTGKDISTQYRYVMDQWYRKSDILGDVYDLYFGTIFADQMIPENRFLNLAHALEAYHRTRWWDTYVMKGKYDQVYEDFMNILARDPASSFSSIASGTEENLRDKYQLPNDFVVALRNGTLKYANEVSLSRRLKDILSLYGNLVSNLPHNIENKTRKVVNTRHYLSHWDDSIPHSTGADLVGLTWGLQQLIEACLLDEIGISNSQIRHRLRSRYSSRSVV